MVGEAPRGEGRRGANERLGLGGWGSAPVRRVNKRGAGLFRCLPLLFSSLTSLAQGVSRVPGCPRLLGSVSPSLDPLEAQRKGKSRRRDGGGCWLVTCRALDGFLDTCASSRIYLTTLASINRETTESFCYEIRRWRSVIGIDLEDG
jgi:hypothetical protein